MATGQIPFTPRAKKVLELSLREALSLGHDYIGTEHVLLGLVRENEGVASRILLDFGVNDDAVRNRIVGMLSGREEVAYEPKSPPLSHEVVEEIEKLAKAKKEALETQDFEHAADLLERQRRLISAARELERAWWNEPASVADPAYAPSPGVFATLSRMPRRVAIYGRPVVSPHLPLLLGWALFAAAMGIGILIGWAIWG